MNPSLWSTHTSSPSAPLTEDLEIATVVIGAGITGLTAALRLSDAGLGVIVLEANTLCSGVTAGTTAHLTQMLDARYHELAQRFGKEEAKLVASAGRAAIDHIASRVDELKIDCDFVRVPGYLYTERTEERGELEKEHVAARDAGLDVTIDATPNLPFAVAGALRVDDQARFHPRDYCLGLAAELRRRGVRICEHTRVTKLSDGSPVVLETESGVTVRAGAVLCATHVPLNFFLVHPKLGHYQSYAMAFPLADDRIEDALFYDTDDPYHYTRVATVDGVRQLVVGGEDHKTGEEDRTERAFAALLGYARSHFGVGEPSYRWSAQVIEPIDGLPYIGRNAASKHVFIATGLSGNGMTLGTIAALVVTDLMTGVASPWAKLFDATRITVSAVGELLHENAGIPKGLLGIRDEQPDVSHPSEIPPGDGRTLHVGGKHLAVYRDPAGQLHAVAARCTHMHCVVRFNQAERTWDCPCHGARFGIDGAVIDGPAVKPLAKHAVE